MSASDLPPVGTVVYSLRSISWKHSGNLAYAHNARAKIVRMETGWDGVEYVVVEIEREPRRPLEAHERRAWFNKNWSTTPARTSWAHLDQIADAIG